MYSSQLVDSVTFKDTSSFRQFFGDPNILVVKIHETKQDFTFLVYNLSTKKASMKLFDLKGSELVNRDLHLDICKKDDIDCGFLNDYNKTTFLNRDKVVFCDTIMKTDTDKEGNEIVVIVSNCDTFNLAERP